MPTVDEEAFKAAVGRFATGVTVVTAHHEGQDAGMTVNAFLSVTLEPPTLLVSLNRKADTTPLVEASRVFGVSILSARQRALSELFASRLPSPQKLDGAPFHRGPRGAPLLDGALAAFECEVVESRLHSTHELFFGRVVHLETGPEGLPLLYWRSGYARSSQGGGLVMSPPPPRRGPQAPHRARTTGRRRGAGRKA